MKKIKLVNMILRDLNAFLTSLNDYMVLTEGDEIKYEQPDLKNQKKILEVLVPYFKQQNLTFSQFNEYVKRDDITRFEQKLVLFTPGQTGCFSSWKREARSSNVVNIINLSSMTQKYHCKCYCPKQKNRTKVGDPEV